MPSTPGSDVTEVIQSADEPSDPPSTRDLAVEYDGWMVGPVGTDRAPTSELERCREACRTALELRHPLQAASDCARVGDIRLAHGDRLESVERELVALRKGADRARCAGAAAVLQAQLELIETLQGRDQGVGSRDEHAMEAEPLAPKPSTGEDDLGGIDQATLLFVRARRSLHALHAFCLRLDHRRAIEEAARLGPLLGALEGQEVTATYHLAAGLAHAALARDAGEGAASQEEHRRELLTHEQALADRAEHRPKDFLCIHALLSAERMRLAADTGAAIPLYERAIRSAHDHGFVSCAAFAYEIASGFYRELGLESFADVYLQEARSCYLAWGAWAKVRAIDEQAPHVIHAALPPEACERTSATGRALAAGSFEGRPRGQQAQTASLVALSQSLASETVRSRLLETLTRMLAEQAGARRAAFIAVKGGRWEIESSTSPMVGVPASIVEHVVRSHERVLLHDATLPNAYSADPYVETRRPRAVYCFPIVRHGALLGVVYLENELAGALFTSNKLAVLELLSDQAGIALENLKLHGEQAREIGERQQAEATLRSILDNLVHAVFVCDRVGRITMVNPAGLRILGWSDVHEGTTMSLEELNERVHALHPDGSPFALDELPLMRALAGEVLSSVDMTLRLAGTGREDHLRLSAAPLQDERGAIAGAVSVGVNVTEAVELDRLKEQFIRVVAHELKTPIAIVKGYADALRRVDEPIPALQRRLLSALIRGADRIDRLVTDLLILWQVQTGRLALGAEQNVDLAELVRLVVDRLEIGGAERVSIVSDASAVVVADRQLLERAVAGLVDNAIRYSPCGGRVDVRICVEDDSAAIEVQDRGIGIPADKQALLFEPFFRAHTDTPWDSGGLGLGLYLARAIAGLHGGNVEAQSTENEGSTFRLVLPLKAEVAGCAV
jgi:PAS domain S-box-containing protein